MVSSEIPHEHERGRILVFDRALALTGTIAAPFPLRDVHEILWHAGRLWVTCSFDNMIGVLDVHTNEWEHWHPLGVSAEPPFDVNHLNSLAMFGETLCVVAHNFGASELLQFDAATRLLRSRIPFGVQSHNIRRQEDALLTCSSAEGALVDTAGWRLDVGGFPRGLWIGERERFVGISEIAERQERDLTTGRIRVFDHEWRPLRTLSLPGEGLLLDIHPLPDGGIV
jgi:hypothetical protein